MNEHSTPEEVRNAASCIVKQCLIRGEKVSESFANFMLRLLAINPEWEQLFKDNTSGEAMKNLIQTCIQKLTERHNPSVGTMKMQVYFDLNFRDANQFLMEHNRVHSRNVQAVLQRILSFHCHTHEDFEMLYNEILVFVMVEENIDHKYNKKAFKEIKAVVSSIIPLSEVPAFLQMSDKNKEEYLYMLAPVAAGIRLYNWHEGRAKSAVNNVNEIAVQCAHKLPRDFERQVRMLESLITALQGILFHYFFYEGINNEELSHTDFSYLKSYLTLINQYEFYMKIILEECSALASEILKLDRAFQLIMRSIKTTLSSSSSSTPSDLFSLYRDASHVWNSLEKGVSFLTSLLNISQTMKYLVKSCHLKHYEDEFLMDLWHEINKHQFTSGKAVQVKNKIYKTMPKTDSDQPESSSDDSKLDTSDVLFDFLHDLSQDRGKNIRIVTSESVKNFNNIYLQFQGFCPWSLVHGKGLLYKGIRDFGIVSYNDCCYAFSCTDARDEFLNDPNHYLSSVMDIVKVQPQLVVLLNLQHKFGINMCNNKIFDTSGEQPIFISDCTCQTVLHPIEKHLDYKYEWNQWQLRKQALKYADMRSTITHSTQTLLSHFRRENFSQVYLPKNNWSQTKRDGCTNMTKAGMLDLTSKKWKRIN